MNHRALAFCFMSLLLVACHPGASVVVEPAPNEITVFDVLFRQNCEGCHGPGGKDGAATALSDPVFLAIADDAAIRRVMTSGVSGTPMSAFAQSAGGMLTDKQIDALVRGIRAWADPGALGGSTPPPYAAQTTGDPHRGADVYRTYCFSCHGVDGRGGRAGSIVDASYLALVSSQDLRVSVIAGRPGRGAPDWRNDVPGRPMSEQEISDVVAWLDAQRSATPGQPYPTTTMDRNVGAIR
jgi:cytochrome c oxidase cbb3-type subunit 3